VFGLTRYSQKTRSEENKNVFLYTPFITVEVFSASPCPHQEERELERIRFKIQYFKELELLYLPIDSFAGK